MTTQATPQQAAEQTHRATAPAVPVAAGAFS
jgi:hypothetical protein